jgi:hypothetical protein
VLVAAQLEQGAATSHAEHAGAATTGLRTVVAHGEHDVLGAATMNAVCATGRCSGANAVRCGVATGAKLAVHVVGVATGAKPAVQVVGVATGAKPAVHVVAVVGTAATVVTGAVKPQRRNRQRSNNPKRGATTTGAAATTGVATTGENATVGVGQVAHIWASA